MADLHEVSFWDTPDCLEELGGRLEKQIQLDAATCTNIFAFVFQNQ